jgi:hypothetical protein
VRLDWEETVLLLDRIKKVSGLPTHDWDHLKLERTIRNPTEDELQQDPDSSDDYKYIPLRRNLRDEELKQLGAWILENVPMPPVFVPSYCLTCGDPARTAVLRLEIVLDAVRLSSGGPERIIGSISFLHHTSRLLVIGRDHDNFNLLWMSPLLEPHRQVFYYRDVNADGKAEIWSLSTLLGASDELSELSIFDESGKELTRDAGDCERGVGATHDEIPVVPTACPITGLPGINHHLENGKIVITADHEYAGERSPPLIYKFVGYRYVRIRTKVKAR